MYEQDFLRIARRVGFEDPRVLDSAPIDVKDPQLIELVGEAKFTSVTYRLFKLPGLLESLCEDYGQVAVYKGTIPGHRHAYQLDDHHRFETGRPMLVCGNRRRWSATRGWGSTLSLRGTGRRTSSGCSLPPRRPRTRRRRAAARAAARTHRHTAAQ